jgi:RNA polymerase sigma-70 factor (ECF subfamily)
VNKKFSPWIYRIAHNEALNYIRKNKNTINLELVEYKILDEKVGIFSELEKDFVKINVNKALSKLNKKYRDPLILFYLEEKHMKKLATY